MALRIASQSSEARLAASQALDRSLEYYGLAERLVEERGRLEQRLAALALESRSEAGGLADLADAAAREQERARITRLVERERRLLDEVNRALAKFERGTFGLCEGTGEPIELRRLRACPWARNTVEYQASLDETTRRGASSRK